MPNLAWLPQVLLTKALAAEWTPAQAAVLRRVSGVESVHEAVRAPPWRR